MLALLLPLPNDELQRLDPFGIFACLLEIPISRSTLQCGIIERQDDRFVVIQRVPSNDFSFTVQLHIEQLITIHCLHPSLNKIDDGIGGVN